MRAVPGPRDNKDDAEILKAFKTIYTALREGQSAWFYKTNFLAVLH